jgi:hypothetical protein
MACTYTTEAPTDRKLQAVDLLNIGDFGTRGSEVQALSPRPIIPSFFLAVLRVSNPSAKQHDAEIA